MTLGLQLWFISATLEEQEEGDKNHTAQTNIVHLPRVCVCLRHQSLACKQEIQHLLRKYSRSQMGELFILDGKTIAVDLEEARKTKKSSKFSSTKCTTFFSVQEHLPLWGGGSPDQAKIKLRYEDRKEVLSRLLPWQTVGRAQCKETEKV